MTQKWQKQQTISLFLSKDFKQLCQIFDRFRDVESETLVVREAFLNK